MQNKYTSDLITVTSNPIELLIDRISTDMIELQVINNDVTINPLSSYVENCIDNKTRIRIYLDNDQVNIGEQIQIKINQI
jgi:hypothetical protein